MVETLQEARLKEFQFKLKQEAELKNLADLGNTFAKHEQKCNETGLKANFRAFLPKQCSHMIQTIPYFWIKADFNISLQIGDGWEIKKKSCSLCGKTLQMCIERAKEPRRGC